MTNNDIKRDKITSVVKDTINGIICEEAFYDSKGELIGYWAYGSYDPSLPYKGE